LATTDYMAGNPEIPDLLLPGTVAKNATVH
jgi:hypothetical protein